MLTPPQVVAFVLFDLAVILILARLCGAAAKKLGQPAVVGEIIAGVLLGPSLLGPTLFGLDSAPAFLSCSQAIGALPPEQQVMSVTQCLFPPQARLVLNAVGQLALLLFMFLVGLELDFKKLMGKTRQITIVALGVVAIPIALGFVIGPVLFNETFTGGPDVTRIGFYLFIGTFLSITALPVLARVLQEKGLSTTEMGTIGVAAAAAVTVLMFIMTAVSQSAAQGKSWGSIIGKAALAFVFIGVMVVVVRPLLERFLGRPYEQRATRMGLVAEGQTWSAVDEFAPAGAGQALSHSMFAWVLALVLLAGWIAYVLGITVIVGGFVVGVIMPVREGIVRDFMVELFDTVAIVLLPVFLAFAGLNTDFTKLSASALGGLALFVAVGIAAKWGVTLVLGRAVGLSSREANLLGILMNCRGLLPLVVGQAGLAAGVISPVMNVAAVTMALITTAMTGPLFDTFNKERQPDRTAA